MDGPEAKFSSSMIACCAPSYCVGRTRWMSATTTSRRKCVWMAMAGGVGDDCWPPGCANEQECRRTPLSTYTSAASIYGRRIAQLPPANDDGTTPPDPPAARINDHRSRTPLPRLFLFVPSAQIVSKPFAHAGPSPKLPRPLAHSLSCGGAYKMRVALSSVLGSARSCTQISNQCRRRRTGPALNRPPISSRRPGDRSHRCVIAPLS